MKWILGAGLVLGLLGSAWAAAPVVPPPPPATQAEVNAGLATRPYVSPATLAGLGGLYATNGITGNQWTQYFNANIVAGVGSNNAATTTLATNVINGPGSIVPSYGGTIYVSSSGSDAAAGSAAAPLATIGQAFTNLGGHGTIVVRGGSYTGQAINGANAGRLTVRAYPGETPNFFFGESIASNSFSGLSNGIFTTTMTAAFSNNLAFLSNYWAGALPFRNSKIILFQTNYPFGSNTNNTYLPLPAVFNRDTQTNRCPVYPLLYTNSIAALTNLNGFYSIGGGTLYVKFGTSNAVGGLWISATNSTDSVIYNLSPSAEVELAGLSSWYAWQGFDLSGAGKVRVVRCRAIGSGENGIRISAAVANSMTEAEVINCESMLTLGRAFYVASLIDGSSFVVVQCRNNCWHDNYRDGSVAAFNVSRTAIGEFSAYNGLADRAHSWPEAAGYGFIDDGSESVFIGCTTKSNSLVGFQLGSSAYSGARSDQRLVGCLMYKDFVSGSIDDYNDSMTLVGCAMQPLSTGGAINVSIGQTLNSIRTYLTRVTDDSAITSAGLAQLIAAAGVPTDGTRYAVEAESAVDTSGTGGLAQQANVMRLIGTAETRIGGTGTTLYNDGFAKFAKGTYFISSANIPAAVSAGDGSLMMSNSVLFWVTATATNKIAP